MWRFFFIYIIFRKFSKPNGVLNMIGWKHIFLFWNVIFHIFLIRKYKNKSTQLIILSCGLSKCVNSVIYIRRPYLWMFCNICELVATINGSGSLFWAANKIFVTLDTHFLNIHWKLFWFRKIFMRLIKKTWYSFLINYMDLGG